MKKVIKITKKAIKFAAKHNIVFVLLTALNAYLAIKGLRTIDLTIFYAIKIIAPLTLFVCFGWVAFKVKKAIPGIKMVFKNIKTVFNSVEKA